MAASTGDKVTDTRNAARPNSAKVSSGRSADGSSLACDNLTGWPTASKVHFVTYKIDSSSTPVAGSQLDCTGIVSGNTIGSMVVVDGTDTGNAVNDVVEMLPTAAWGQDLADALTAQHTRTGTHKNITNTGGITTDTLTVTGAATLTGGTTLAAGDIATADIADSAITSAKILDGTIAFGDLLSTIFSSQVLSSANGGSAGGTVYYVNLGGIKLAWGVGTAQSTSNGTATAFAFSIPAFFTTVTAVMASLSNHSGSDNVNANVGSISTSTINIILLNFSGSTAGGIPQFFAVGT